MKRPDARGLELVSVGFTLVVATLLGYLGGNWLDGRFGTQPWLGVVGLLLGAAAGFVQLFRIVGALGRSNGDRDGQ